MVKAGDYPEFYKFTQIGEELIGKITGTRQLRRQDGKEDTIYNIKTGDGKEWSLPSYAVLGRLLVEQNVQAGDFVLIRYEGERKTKRGRPAKLFSLGRVPEEEAETVKANSSPPPPFEVTEEHKKAIDFAKKLFEFYPDGMSKADLERRIQARGLKVDVNEVIVVSGLKEEGDVVKVK